MSQKTNDLPSDRKTPGETMKPPMLQGLGNQAALSNAASRRMIAAQLKSGAANHARHHVSRQTQS